MFPFHSYYEANAVLMAVGITAVSDAHLHVPTARTYTFTNTHARTVLTGREQLTLPLIHTHTPVNTHTHTHTHTHTNAEQILKCVPDISRKCLPQPLALWIARRKLCFRPF